MNNKRSTTFLVSWILFNSVLFLSLLITRSYLPVIMYLHIISLVLMWGFVFWKAKIGMLLRNKWKEVGIIVSLIIVSLHVGFYQLEAITPGMYPDEMGVTQWGLELMERSDLPPFNQGEGHGTPLLYMTAGSVQTFGHTVTAIRLPYVVFGALAVGLFYILLRLFLPLPFAIGGAMLLTFQYTHIILSRLAYEPIPSLFFQLLTLIFLVLFWRKREQVYFVGIALGISAGMYTYLNFRVFAAFIFFLTITLILKNKGRHNVKNAFLFAGLVFAAAAPLCSFVLLDWQSFWGRASAISLFGRHYPPMEFIKELAGNIYRTVGFPFFGDPNPGKNPSGVTIFDPFTLLLAVLGGIFLWLRQKKMFFIALLFFIPPIASDIFSTEVIPDFHYYGLGHPNALRVSGLIPVVLFAAIYGLYRLHMKWGRERVAESITVGSIIIGAICLLNWNWYFNQDANPMFFVYNYKYNHAKIIKTVKELNTTDAVSVGVSKELMEYGYMEFMLDPRKKLSSFEVTSSASAVAAVTQNDVTAIALTQQTATIVNEIADTVAAAGYNAKLLIDPLNNPDIVIFEK